MLGLFAPLALGAAVFFAMSAFASSTADVDVRVTHYPVSGASKTQLRASLDRERASVIPGGEHDAHTRWHIDWRFSYERGENFCRINKVSVTLDAHMILPRWINPPREKLNAEWSRYISALTAHEDGHVEIARAAKSSIENSIAAASPEEDCAKLDEAINARARAILGTFQEREVQYDRSTRHGFSQGARFP